MRVPNDDDDNVNDELKYVSIANAKKSYIHLPDAGLALPVSIPPEINHI